MYKDLYSHLYSGEAATDCNKDTDQEIQDESEMDSIATKVDECSAHNLVILFGKSVMVFFKGTGYDLNSLGEVCKVI